jgi:HAE1 family hydrophobic/amphiphilic exporter-1
MTLPELAVKRPIATLMVLISILVLGLIALSRLELGFMPEQEEKNLFVVIQYPNASPKAIERLVVKPLEDALASVNGLEHMWSNADSRGGRVNLSFGFDVDMDLARAEIHERIDRTREDLPEDIERIQVAHHWNPRESGETIMEARISSGRDLSHDYDLLDRKIVKPLERIPGVAVVSLDGVNPREVRINLDLKKLKQHNVDARQIWAAITQNNQNLALGVLRDDSRRATLRSLGQFTSVEEIEQLPLPGKSLVLSDVASVTYQEPPLEYGRHLDGEFAVGLNISKESSANTITITDAVHERIKAMEDDPELQGINFLVWQDQGREIKKTLNDLKQTGFFGAILASIVLFLFLRRFSTTLVAVICIPFSLIVACGVVWALGKSMNTITLLGLIVGLGMLVDNAVVIMENIDRYQKKGYGGHIAAILGSKEVSIAVITATLTSLIVFLPMIFSKPTNINLILRELGLTICYTLMASLFISQTMIPLAARKLLHRPKKQRKMPVMNWLQKHYSRILGYTLKHRWLAIVVGLGVLAATAYPISNITFNFEGARTEMFVGVRLQFEDAASLEVKEDYVNQLEAALEPYKERFKVQSIYSYWSDNFTTTRLYMIPGFQNDEHMNKIRKALPGIMPKFAGVTLQVQDNTPFWRRGGGKRVGAQLQGPDSEVLGQIGNQAMERVKTIPGLFDHMNTAEGGQIELHAELDRDRMSAFGISNRQPSDIVELTFRGRRLPRYKGDEGEVEMRLTLGEQESVQVEELKNLPLLKEGGSTVPMDSFTSFSLNKGPDRIQRQNKVSGIWVGARFEEGDKAEYARQVREVLQDMELPNGYQWDFQNRNTEEEESQREFVINLLLALGLIYAVMASLFESLRQAFALMVSLPFALAGAFWTLFFFGVDFDRPASVALLLLLGIVVNNGIVMIEHINLYRRDGWDREKAMIQGGKERLRPIIMTALTTLVGLLPMAIQKPSLGGTYYYSMAYVIMGGLLMSTLLTTIFLPATIAIIEDLPGWLKRLGGRSLGWALRPLQRVRRSA